MKSTRSPVFFMNLAWLVVLSALSLPIAHAMITQIPTNLEQDVLSETVPTAFAPFALDSEDYAVEWVGAAPAGVDLKLMPGTLQWVRVMDVLVLPRARVEVVIRQTAGHEPSGGGRIANAGFSQPLVEEKGSFSGRLPVALLSGARNPIDIAWTEGGKTRQARALLRYKPRSEGVAPRVFADPSCSRFGVTTLQPPKGSRWAYVGCRAVELDGTPDMAASLEMFVYWDGAPSEIRVGGAPTPSTATSLWPLRLRSQPGEVRLSASDGGELAFSYRLAPVYHRGSLGLGLGPYTDHFEGGGQDFSTVAPILTLYGSYFVTEDMRFVAFGAGTFDRTLTSDLGIYIHTASLRVIDRRVVSSLLLGAHSIGFRAQGTYRVMAGLPQGFELTFIDAFRKGSNATAGFFLYPAIDGKSYYNVWLRWGSGALFGEVNYISWGERPDGEQFHGRYFGVSVGFPLARFL